VERNGTAGRTYADMVLKRPYRAANAIKISDFNSFVMIDVSLKEAQDLSQIRD
jgi:hypothetical protein